MQDQAPVIPSPNINASQLHGLAAQFGLTPEQVDAVTQAIMPVFATKLEKRSLSRGGLADLVELMGYARDATPDGTSPEQAEIDKTTADTLGLTVLDQVLGSKDTSRFLANSAAKKTGVPAETIRRMLPGIGAAAFTDVAARTAPQIDDLVSKLNIDGNNRSLPQQAPLPVPGEFGGGHRTGGRYGELSDIIRTPKRQRPNVGGGPSGGGLDTILRDALGKSMGYRNRGVMGWILRAALTYFIWPMIRRFLGRMIGGR
jgi:hypothetical protein